MQAAPTTPRAWTPRASSGARSRTWWSSGATCRSSMWPTRWALPLCLVYLLHSDRLGRYRVKHHHERCQLHSLNSYCGVVRPHGAARV